jgi:DNA polymerase-3 subunit beta
MKFKCDSKELSKAINSLSRISNKTGDNTPLSSIFLKVEDHNLIVRATNLEIIIEKNIPIKGEMNGSVLINAALISKIISNFAKDSDFFEVEKINNTLQINSGENSIDFQILEETDFPTVPTSQKLIAVMNKNVFSTLIKSVSFCAATSEIKPEIASVYLYTKDTEIVAVATDSYRLAEKKTYSNIEGSLNIILPIKNIINIISILDDANDEDITIDSYEDGIIISNKSLFIATRVVNGNFPDYKQLFPKDFNYELFFKKNDILNTLQLTTFISLNAFCNLKFDFEKSELLITSKENNVGSIKKKMKIEFNKKEGDEVLNELEVTYNSNYFIECLSKLPGDNFKMTFVNEKRPVFITSRDDNSFTYLLMPLNR